MKILSFLDDNTQIIANKGTHDIFNGAGDFDTTVDYDAVMYDVLTLVSFEDHRDTLVNKNIFKISVLSGIDELDVFKNFRTDGWILEDKLNKLPEFLDKTKEYL